MDDMQSQMSAILGNPEMMQKIMAMAQSINQSSSEDPPPKQEKQEVSLPQLPDFDLSTIQRLSGLAGQSNIDNNQRSLLKALGPYLSQERITKLERAMRAARIANLASSFLEKSGISLIPGR